MFESITVQKQGSAKRRATTSLLSLGIHGALIAGAVLLSAAVARHKTEEPVNVTFFRPPPPPPPPAGHRAKTLRPHVQRPTQLLQPLVQPKEIPQEKPPETASANDDDDSDDGEEGGVEGGVAGGVAGGVIGGVVGGQVGGVLGGTGEGPVQLLGGGMTKPEPTVACGRLMMPEQARTMGITGRVIVDFVTHADGTVDPSKFKVMGNSPPLLVEAVKRWLLNCTFKPAMQEGRPIPVRQIMPFKFDFTN